MVMRTIEIKEISFEVEPDKIEEIVKKIKELYPDLVVKTLGNTVFVSGDLRNYKRRRNVIFILSSGKHGKTISSS